MFNPSLLINTNVLLLVLNFYLNYQLSITRKINQSIFISMPAIHNSDATWASTWPQMWEEKHTKSSSRLNGGRLSALTGWVERESENKVMLHVNVITAESIPIQLKCICYLAFSDKQINHQHSRNTDDWIGGRWPKGGWKSLVRGRVIQVFMPFQYKI